MNTNNIISRNTYTVFCQDECIFKDIHVDELINMLVTRQNETLASEIINPLKQFFDDNPDIDHVVLFYYGTDEHGCEYLSSGTTNFSDHISSDLFNTLNIFVPSKERIKNIWGWNYTAFTQVSVLNENGLLSISLDDYMSF